MSGGLQQLAAHVRLVADTVLKIQYHSAAAGASAGQRCWYHTFGCTADVSPQPRRTPPLRHPPKRSSIWLLVYHSAVTLLTKLSMNKAVLLQLRRTYASLRLRSAVSAHRDALTKPRRHAPARASLHKLPMAPLQQQHSNVKPNTSNSTTNKSMYSSNSSVASPLHVTRQQLCAAVCKASARRPPLPVLPLSSPRSWKTLLVMVWLPLQPWRPARRCVARLVLWQSRHRHGRRRLEGCANRATMTTMLWLATHSTKR